MSQLPAKYYLVTKQGPDAGTTHALQGNTLTAGRQFDNYLVIDDSQVSRYHVRLTWHASTYHLEDLNSKNGTWVNDVRVRNPVALKIGDVIDLGGKSRFVFSDGPQLPSLREESATSIQAPMDISTVVGSQAEAPRSAPLPPKCDSNRLGLGLMVGILVFIVALLCVVCLAFGAYQFGYFG